MAPAAYRLHPGNSRLNLFLCKSKAISHSRCCQSIVYHMFTGQRNLYGKYGKSHMYHSMGSEEPSVHHIRSKYFIGGISPEMYGLMVSFSFHQTKHIIITIDKSITFRIGIVKDFRLRLKYSFPRTQVFQMTLPNIGHDTNVRFCNSA